MRAAIEAGPIDVSALLGGRALTTDCALAARRRPGTLRRMRSLSTLTTLVLSFATAAACGVPDVVPLDGLTVEEAAPPVFAWEGGDVSRLAVHACPEGACPEVSWSSNLGKHADGVERPPLWSLDAMDGFECTVPALPSPVTYGVIPDDAAPFARVFNEAAPLEPGARLLVVVWRTGHEDCLSSTVEEGRAELTVPAE